ncbi:MAG: polyketide synthase dehydratase domain-containing protein [Planctomycetes bacterium]|nr:polyketide synthase dehydratase domain-containing protein [Planctomycetota bacterium]MBI3834055.1 polyketide synthase dehydratase domain-containing protein [Planctomycetota bacterium]
MTASAARQAAQTPAVRGDVAIIGIACTFPAARNVGEFWRNIVRGVDAITEVSPQRWDPSTYYDPNPSAAGKIYCKRGGYIGNSFTFNPLKFGTMPKAVEGAEPDQFLVLRAAYEALDDAGYLHREFSTETSAFILGRGNYLGAGLSGLVQRGMITEQTLKIIQSLRPDFSEADFAAIRAELQGRLPGFGANNAPGLIPNITTGRVANRMNLMGPTYTVDAACASSLIATENAVRGLLTGAYDFALAGGVHIFTDVSFLHVFCAMGALSHSGVIRPFDQNCDGTISGEGVGLLVLKRLADAERDGDRIYAVIKGVGSSSDGKAMSVTAPRVEGEQLALRRAYEMSGVEPASVELIEAHGTGTPIGDATEVETLQSIFGPAADSDSQTCALGSVKSMIGHAMPAAGAAAMIKTALSLYHGVLPPSLHCDRPNDLLNRHGRRFYVSDKARPWIHAQGSPRRAGVNAFGFGGVNAHVVLEEYRPTQRKSSTPQSTTRAESQSHTIGKSLLTDWEAELCIIEGASRTALLENAKRLAAYANTAQGVALRDVAFTLNTSLKGLSHRAAIVVSSISDLAKKLARLVERLADESCKQIKDAQGIYYLHDSPVRGGKLAFLFPGLGGQHTNMLSDLCMHFPLVRECFDNADRAITSTGMRPLSRDVFPPPAPSDEQASEQELHLSAIERANPAVLTANGAMYLLLESLGVKPDMMTGHSSGEWVVMPASGMVTIDEFVSSMSGLSDVWRRLNENDSVPAMAMLNIGTDRETVAQIAAELDRPIIVANDNCPHQVVIVVAPQDVEAVLQALRGRGIFAEKLPYTQGYHTTEFGYVTDSLRGFFNSMRIEPSRVKLYSCTTAKPYPTATAEVVELLAHTFARPLLFRDTLEAMYADGARIFLEVGPRGNLTAFADDIFRGRPHAAIATQQYRKPGLISLQHALAQLAALHVPFDARPLYARRGAVMLTLEVSQDSRVDEANEIGAMQISLCSPQMSLSPRPLPTAPASVEYRSSEGKDVALAEPIERAALTRGSEQRVELSSTPADAALQEHFRLMESFLQTNEDVMRAFLGGQTAQHDQVSTNSSFGSLSDFAAQEDPSENGSVREAFRDDQHANSARLLEVTSPSPGLDAPILPAENRAAGTSAAKQDVASSLVPQVGTTAESIESVLLGIVSDRTGYPTDMLGLDLDMEADLGIDSIKRVEILGALQQRSANGGESTQVDMEAVARLKTLRQIVAFLSNGAATTPLPDPQKGTVPSQSNGGSAPNASASVSTPVQGGDPRLGPLIGEVTRNVPGKEVVVVRRIDVNEDLYLADHCFDPFISDEDPDRERLCIVPLTVSVEMMAETAALVIPELKVVGARGLQAAKWIEVEPGGPEVVLEITAQRSGDCEVRVTIRRYDANRAATQPASALAEGTFRFAAEYPPAIASAIPTLNDSRTPRHTGEDMYAKRRMFHGPRFRGVTTIDAVGSNGLRAKLEVLPTHNLVRSNSAPNFIIDPCLLDAAGQLVGYWPVEYCDEGFVLFPIRINELTLYRENLKPGAKCPCELQIADVSRRQLRANMDIFTPDGGLWMRITGWEDWRFYWDHTFYDFWRFPNKGVVSERLELPIPEMNGDIECRRMSPFGEMGSSIWENLWAHLILNRAELEQYRSMKDGPRRTEWIFGRAAAKDSVRMWVKRHFDLDLFPADVEITQDANGKPGVRGGWTRKIDRVPIVSISHKGKTAVAAAASVPIGIDMESVESRDRGFEQIALSDADQDFLDDFSLSDRADWVTRLWSAKESVGKLLGVGLRNGFQQWKVRSMDRGTNTIVLCGPAGQDNGEEANREFIVRSRRDGETVISVAFEGKTIHATH